MTEPLRLTDWADLTPTRALMRLGWGGPVHVPDMGGSMQFFLPDDNTCMSPYMEYLHRHPYQNRQVRIHALWQVGCRKQAQALYWQGKLKRKGRR